LFGSISGTHIALLLHYVGSFAGFTGLRLFNVNGLKTIRKDRFGTSDRKMDFLPPPL
jgi:hypothetical protein